MGKGRYLTVGAGMLLIAGCGSATASGTSATPTAGGFGARGAFGGGGTSGQLVQVNGTTLTVSTTKGDVTVTYTGSTPITQASTGPTADIVAGSCVVIVGTKDATGAVTASSVSLRPAVNGACTGTGFGGAGGGGFTRPSGAPTRSGVPTLNPNTTFVNGMVTAVSGTQMTVQSATGSSTTITVPTTLTVNETQPASASDLTVNICLLARGTKDSSGVVAATALTIEPLSPSGTCIIVGGRGGFGGFGRGGGGGGGGGAPTSASTTTT